MKPGEPPKVFPASPIASTWVTALLAVYCGGAFALSLARRLDWPSVAFTGLGLGLFAAMTAANIRLLRRERKAQSEYSFTASRHISKPVRSP